MHYVLFAISALAGAAGFALLRWSASREQPAAPGAGTEPAPPPVVPEPATERPPPPKPLRITVVVEPADREEPGPTITLPPVHLAVLGDHGPKTPTTYLIERVQVELNDFFDGVTATPRRTAADLRHCDVVVRTDGPHSRQVVTRAAMPVAVLVEDEALVETCARALADPTLRPAFADQVVEAVREGGVLGWLERHERALSPPRRTRGPGGPTPAHDLRPATEHHRT
ncbi:hypothetical protein [Umezawaea sp.]|uniref:hypothetical protein n=1 Tax=Umezawaea sp. TaxID=1955258 RepID=UPI002ED080EC